MSQAFNFELSTFVTSQHWMRAAQPRHFFAQMWNDIMYQKAEATRRIYKDVKQQRLKVHTPQCETDFAVWKAHKITKLNTDNQLQPYWTQWPIVYRALSPGLL